MDIKTLIICLFSINLFLGFFIYVIKKIQKTYLGINYWIIANFVIAGGYMFLLNRSAIPDFFSIILAHSLFLIGSLLRIYGLRIFFNQKFSFLKNMLFAITFIMFLLLLMYYTYFQNSMVARSVIISIFFTGINITTGIQILNNKPDKKTYSYNFTSILIFISSLILIFRLIYIVLFPETVNLFGSTLINNIQLLSSMIFEISLPIMFFIFHYQRVIKESEESEEKYRTMVQYSSDPIFSFNPNETYRFVNEIFAKNLGKKPEDIIGKTPHSIFSYEEAEKRLEHVRKVFRSSEKSEIDVKVDLPDGKIIYFVTLIDPIKDEHGKICWVSCISKNITERKEAEITIKLQNDKLGKLIDDKNRFMSILAHDLRGPFNSILGFLDLLLINIRKYDTDKIEKHINIVYNSAQNTYDLLEDLLIWAGAQSGKLPFEPQKNKLSAICNNAIENLKLNANNKNIAINYLGGDEIFIFADTNMINTILRNLISNAIKFTKHSGLIEIHAEKNSTSATITVIDSGVGIEADSLTNIFDSSKRNTTLGTSNEKGTGLGLLLCKEFIEKHGGNIWVKSELGRGSEFKFTIPLFIS